MTTLDVRLEGLDTPVGTLSGGADGGIAFRYADAYLAHPAAHPISLSLPLGEAPYDDRAARPYFQNLLPENDLLRAVIDREGLAIDDIVGLLAHLGADVSGAIACLPPDAPPVKMPGLLWRDYDPIDRPELDTIVRRLASGGALPEGLRDPSPVAGYQRKIALARLPDGRFAMPRPGTGVPTTHILKVPDGSFPREAHYEARLAELAAEAGLDAAATDSGWIADYEVVVSTRFDRVVSPAGEVTRLHLEDFAQALGLPPRLKYQRTGNAARRYDVAAIAGVLRRTADPAAATDAFLRSVIFNLATGNTDNHAKNHGLIYDVGSIPRLAPLYDLVPIRLSEQHHHLFSFAIGDAQAFDALTAGDLAALCGAFGMTASGSRRYLQRTVPPLLAALAGRPRGDDGWSVALDRLIDANCARLAALLGEL